MASLARTVAGAALVAALVAGCTSDDPPETTRTEPTSVRVVSQNLLHGIACPADSDGCDLPGRVRLFLRQLDEAGCPELVGLQEATERTVAYLREGAADVCDGDYELVGGDDPGLDREVVLSTLPVLGAQRTRLAGPLRTALWVRVAADVGIVDFVSSHLASSSDDRPCDDATCPPLCEGDEMVNACQARQLVAFAEDVAARDSVVIVGGDLNAQPGDPALATLVAGGFTDTHLAAEVPECDPTSGAQCTSGRADDSLDDLTDPTSRQSERIDYVLFGGPRSCRAIAPTGLFNGEPAAPDVNGLVFPSDHTGVQATIECDTTEAQRSTAPSATVPSTTTTTTEPGEVDPETRDGINEAYDTLFGGEVTDVDEKLASLEDGELLRPFFLEAYEAQQPIASRIRVRIDAVTLVDATHADVTYTLLLDDAAVLDHLPGAAVLVDGRWLVTRRTYCDVSTQGAAVVPPPCQ